MLNICALGPIYLGEKRKRTISMDGGETPSCVPNPYFEGPERQGRLSELIQLRRADNPNELEGLFFVFRNAILSHFEAKFHLAFVQMALVQGSGLTYTQHGALNQAGKGKNPIGHKGNRIWSHTETHVATVPCLLFRHGNFNRILGKGTSFFRVFNMTTLLPKFVDKGEGKLEVASLVEGMNLRTFLEGELNALSQNNKSLGEAFSSFSTRAVEHAESCLKGAEGVSGLVFRAFRKIAKIYRRRADDPEFIRRMLFNEPPESLRARLIAEGSTFPLIGSAVYSTSLARCEEVESLTEAVILRAFSATETSKRIFGRMAKGLAIDTRTRGHIFTVLENEELCKGGKRVLDSFLRGGLDGASWKTEVEGFLTPHRAKKKPVDVHEICLWVLHEISHDWVERDGLSSREFQRLYFAANSTFFDRVNTLLTEEKVKKALFSCLGRTLFN